MRCPYCGQEHPDDFKFCSEIGKSISQLKACTNPDCPDFGKHILPAEAKFCPRCGQSLYRDVQKEQERENANNGITCYNIVLGETTVTMLQDEYNLSMDIVNEGDINIYKLSDSIFCITKAEVAPIVGIQIEDIKNNIDIASEILRTQGELTPTKLKSVCRKRNWQYRCDDEKKVIIILQTDIKIRCICCYFDDDLLTGIDVLYLPKCPHCNSLESAQLESIDDTEGIILRCKHCRRKYSLVEAFSKEIETCPNCGSDDFDDNGNGYVQYTCNKCGYIWGDGENEEDKDEDNQDDKKQIDQFFPVSGIVLEQSTVEDAERQLYRYSKIEYCDSGLVIAWDNGAQIRKEARCNLFTTIYLTNHDYMPAIWRIRGFKWDLSYEQWIALFKKLHFRVIQTQSPRISSWNNGKDPDYFDADFVAIANDNSIKFALDFSLGRQGTKASSKSTLYSITACSPSYDVGYTNGIGMRVNFDNLEHIYECTLGPAKEI